MKEDIFDSCVRTADDRAGVFEYDGEAGFFYLYDTERAEGHKVVDAVQVLAGETELTAGDIAIRWDGKEAKVGLFIRGVLWVVFDTIRNAKFGGMYVSGRTPNMPPHATSGFEE